MRRAPDTHTAGTRPGSRRPDGCRLPFFFPATTRPRIGFLARLAVLSLVGFGGLSGCGGGSGGPDEPREGTIALTNETDQGMAPEVVDGFFLQPTGGSPLPGNLLRQDLVPGAVVIVGEFAEGFYDATATLESGFNVVFLERQVRAGQPTTFRVRF